MDWIWLTELNPCTRHTHANGDWESLASPGNPTLAKDGHQMARPIILLWRFHSPEKMDKNISSTQSFESKVAGSHFFLNRFRQRAEKVTKKKARNTWSWQLLSFRTRTNLNRKQRKEILSGSGASPPYLITRQVINQLEKLTAHPFADLWGLHKAFASSIWARQARGCQGPGSWDRSST